MKWFRSGHEQALLLLSLSVHNCLVMEEVSILVCLKLVSIKINTNATTSLEYMQSCLHVNYDINKVAIHQCGQYVSKYQW